MAKFNSTQTSFSKGYLSKRLAARPDIEEYYQSCEEIVNLIPMPQGGVKKRQGTRLVAQVPEAIVSSSAYAPPVAFSHMVGDGEYVFAMYHSDVVPVQNPIAVIGSRGKTIVDTDVTAAAKIVLNAMLLDHNRYDGLLTRTVSVGNYIMIYHTSGKYAPVLFTFTDTPTTITLKADTWFEATDAEFPPNWARTPYRALDVTVAATASGANTQLVANKAIFSAASVGQFYRYDYGTVSYIGQIVSYTNPTTVIISQIRGGGIVNPNINNLSRAYFGPETGYPRAATTFQQRTVFANVFDAPDTVFGSHVSNRLFFMNTNLIEDKADRVTSFAYAYNFYGGIKNTDPYVFNIASEYDTPVQWIAGGNVLYIGKSDAEFTMTGYEQLLGPLNVATQKKASEGGARVPAIALEEGVFYVSASGKETNFLVYNERNGSSSSIGVSSTSFGMVEDLDLKYGNTRFNTNIFQLIYLPSANLIFATTVGQLSSNNLLSLTYNSSVNSFAWAEFEIGKDVGGISSSTVLSMARKVTTGQVFFIMERYDSGGVKHTIESWAPAGDFYIPDMTDDPSWPVSRFTPFDSCDLLPYNNTPYTQIVGGDLYAGKGMRMYSDQGLADIVFDALGTATLPYPVLWAWFGYPYRATLTTVSLQYGKESETALGRPKKIDTLTFSLLHSKGGEWKDKTTYPIRFPNTDYYTGDIVMQADTNFSVTPRITISQNSPEPFTLLAVTFKGAGYGA